MSDLQVSFYDRALDGLQDISNLRYIVDELNWVAQGGCSSAKAVVSGEILRVWDLAEKLRYGIEIKDGLGRSVWWGFLSDIRIRINAIEIGVSIDSMFNSVKVAYSFVDPGTAIVGERKTTSAATDSDSINEYGTKELVSSMDGLSDDAADRRRDSILQNFKWPVGVGNIIGSKESIRRAFDENQVIEAELYMRGWFETLGWRYATETGTDLVITTDQISDLITTYGEFITGTDIDEQSAISSSQFRDGDTQVKDEILSLLDAGGQNDRRLLCSVNVDRRLLVWEEPDLSEIDYQMDSFGVVYELDGTRIDEFNPPIGVYIRLQDVIPDSADLSKLLSPDVQFVDGARWNRESGLSLIFRGQISIDDMFRIR
jgi:hypothetical protein